MNIPTCSVLVRMRENRMGLYGGDAPYFTEGQREIVLLVGRELGEYVIETDHFLPILRAIREAKSRYFTITGKKQHTFMSHLQKWLCFQ